MCAENVYLSNYNLIILVSSKNTKNAHYLPTNLEVYTK